jgi:hypothetical protein
VLALTFTVIPAIILFLKMSQEVTVTGVVLHRELYWGGAAPTPEMIARSEKIKVKNDNIT